MSQQYYELIYLNSQQTVGLLQNCMDKVGASALLLCIH